MHILSACNEYLGDINNDVLLLYLINLSLHSIPFVPSFFLTCDGSCNSFITGHIHAEQRGIGKRR